MSAVAELPPEPHRLERILGLSSTLLRHLLDDSWTFGAVAYAINEVEMDTLGLIDPMAILGFAHARRSQGSQPPDLSRIVRGWVDADGEIVEVVLPSDAAISTPEHPRLAARFIVNAESPTAHPALELSLLLDPESRNVNGAMVSLGRVPKVDKTDFQPVTAAVYSAGDLSMLTNGYPEGVAPAKWPEGMSGLVASCNYLLDRLREAPFLVNRGLYADQA